MTRCRVGDVDHTRTLFDAGMEKPADELGVVVQRLGPSQLAAIGESSSVGV